MTKKNAQKSRSDQAALVTFGKRVESLRKDDGLTQHELLERAPLKGAEHSQSWLSRVEGGLVDVGLLDIMKLARALGVRPCELLTGS